jgi:predicted nucleotide-binding protein
MNVIGENITFGKGSRAGHTYINPLPPPAQPEPRTPPDPPEIARRVFVVYGRDGPVRDAMFEFLRALDLRPREWDQLINDTEQAAPFVGDVVARGVQLAPAAVVLLTPDDVVGLHPSLRKPGEPGYEVGPVCQPRPNVLIELGMVLAVYPNRTVIVEIGDHRPISDLRGRDVIRFDGSLEAIIRLAVRLKAAGLATADDGMDWRRTDRFRGLDAYSRRP